ncbi:hypothetical protein LCGC14_1823390 [marine sediment metagenome]|uniref:Uncharacterized protein n=1 Tax=marine sediment metagenome TaxID=412755 RepID=A0A0F9JHQ8_9ZZZZ
MTKKGKLGWILLIAHESIHWMAIILAYIIGRQTA